MSIAESVEHWYDGKGMYSNRGLMWEVFSDEVLQHVEKYTVPQYGDFPNDQMTEWANEDFVTTIKRYINRAGKNARGPEEDVRDLLKIAHYAGTLWAKITGAQDVLASLIYQDEDNKKED